MNQLEIQYFWPLTEQIQLDLDYSECIPKKDLYTTTASPLNTGSFILTNSVTSTVRPVLHFDYDNNITLYMKDAPWYRKMLYKLLGIKLTIK